MAIHAQNAYWIQQTQLNQPGPTPDSTEGKFNVKVTIGQHFQYYGGAYPDESQMNNYSLMPGAIFNLYNLDTGEKTIVRTNANGILELNLFSGKYALRETYKDCTFDEFYTKYKAPDYEYQDEGNEDCYKNWWKSNFMEFIVTIPGNPQTFNYTFYHPCFTDNNPCVTYFGPYPP